MSTSFVIIFVFGIYLIVSCQDEKVDLSSTPIKNASYYWPFNKTFPLKGGIMVKEVQKNGKAHVMNNAKVTKVKQLGHALVLDGITQQWVDIKGFADPCIWKLSCPKGLSVGFWINFKSGDYILAAGGYAGMTSPTDDLNGFRLQRDKKTKYHTLEVANGEKKWQIYIEPFPTNKWVYLAFSWSRTSGLKLYFNGELTFTSNKPTLLPRGINKRNNRNTIDAMHIGRRDNLQEFDNYGNFMIAHLAIWEEELSEDKFEKAYKAHITIDIKDDDCCYKKRNEKKHCGDGKDNDNATYCICPKYKTRELMCDETVVEISSSCEDTLEYCSELVTNQDYCSAKDLGYHLLCQESCRRCGNVAQRSGPLQHFSEKTLIFALLGCVGGLVILFGATVYFWKVYRTRYQGTFIPQIKTVSLLDVSDYEDEKWPNKYIDSAAYYIKDVPPKKRPLPLLPAKMTQNQIHRYQPPEFD